jgi:hypothetical protein
VNRRIAILRMTLIVLSTALLCALGPVEVRAQTCAGCDNKTLCASLCEDVQAKCSAPCQSTFSACLGKCKSAPELPAYEKCTQGCMDQQAKCTGSFSGTFKQCDANCGKLFPF